MKCAEVHNPSTAKYVEAQDLPAQISPQHGVLDTPESTVGRWSKLGRWYLNRLYCMSPREICHRAGRALAIRMERWRVESVPLPIVNGFPAARAWIHAPEHADRQRYLDNADTIVSGRFDIFALRGVQFGMPPRWNRDPKSGIEAPLRFGKLLDYRDARLVGDIKYLWEPNRHGHLVALAQAYALCGARRYLDAIRAHLTSWFDACPYARGPNWSSALEAALRLVSWSVVWQLVGGANSPAFDQPDGAAFRRRWLESVYRHAEFTYGYFSRYSSANNHLIGEAAGLFIASLTWPFWPRSRVWQSDAKAILEREIVLQNAPDGVNLEQATAYQRFELELLIVCWLAAEANACTFSSAFRARLVAMLEFVASIMDVGGNVPMIGDSDDAVVVRLDPDPGFCGYRSLLATGAVLFGRADFARKAVRLDARTRWLVKGAETSFPALRDARSQLPVRQAFPEGGYYVLGCDFERENEIRLVVDAGPLGYQAIAAHGHADALAFTLSLGGVEIFIDPGTYAYHTHEVWRQYFRSTAAHNTVRIDGKEQSVIGGKFMWMKKARASCTVWHSSGDADRFEGWHDGYARLQDPVTHRRRITLQKLPRRIIVEDVLEMKGTHEVELFFHCSEQCQVYRMREGYRIDSGKGSILLKLPQGDGALSVHRGSLAPILGWVSRRFDVKQPTATIRWHGRLEGASTLRSEIIVLE